MPAIFFGSISTLADTSELQRKAFNDAFARHGLDWSWSREDYRAMLGSNGGANRVADYAAERGASVDAAAVHSAKSAIFQESLKRSGARPRPGVLATVQHAKEHGYRLALVTTTSPANVAALLDALGPDITEQTFDLLVTADDVGEPKPDPAAYRFALDRLGLDPADVVAIEDNVGGVRAAAAAGLRVVAFPNENTAAADFGDASERTDQLDAARVAGMAAL